MQLTHFPFQENSFSLGHVFCPIVKLFKYKDKFPLCLSILVQMKVYINVLKWGFSLNIKPFNIIFMHFFWCNVSSHSLLHTLLTSLLISSGCAITPCLKSYEVLGQFEGWEYTINFTGEWKKEEIKFRR